MTTEASIGLIAGNGQFPVLFAQAARARGVRVAAVGMRGETEAKLADWVDSLIWVHVGQIGRTVKALRRAGIAEAAMAGGLDKRRLFQRARPDWLGLTLLAKSVLRRDDSLLRALAHTFAQNGITIVDSTVFMPEAMAPLGRISGPAPSRRQWQDLRYGFDAARHIGALDIGQTVVVRDGAVVAIEGIEGTDACIARAGALTFYKGAVVVKVAKPQQDMRFDVPAIGTSTVQCLKAAGVQVLGIEAGRTLILQPDAFRSAADAAGITCVGLTAAESFWAAAQVSAS